MDMVGEGFMTTLVKSLEEGKIKEAQINLACRRILEAKYKLGLFEDPYRYCDQKRADNEIFTAENNRIARETAAQTFVLLKNNNQLLPLAKKGKIALVGPLADSKENMPGVWSGAGNYTQCITVLEGFKDAAGDRAEIVYARGCNIVDDSTLDARTNAFEISSIDPHHSPRELMEHAVAVASQADVVVAVLGESLDMSGESAGRSDISLPGSQEELLKALLKTGKPVVLVLFTGRPLAITWEQENIPAILDVWFGGTQAGAAIADVIFGDVNPSGKLPVTFPRSVGQVPVYYNHKNTGRPIPEGHDYEKYLSGYLDIPNDPLYPFGFGLSYTQFTYGDLVLDKTELTGDQSLAASISLANTGKYDGAEVVQLYIRDPVGSMTRPVKELKGFQKVFLKAGETTTVTFTITPEDLRFYNYNLQYDWEPGEFIIMAGGNSRDVKSAKVNWVK
jgi:beta-glucosidase